VELLPQALGVGAEERRLGSSEQLFGHRDSGNFRVGSAQESRRPGKVGCHGGDDPACVQGLGGRWPQERALGLVPQRVQRAGERVAVADVEEAVSFAFQRREREVGASFGDEVEELLALVVARIASVPAKASCVTTAAAVTAIASDTPVNAAATLAAVIAKTTSDWPITARVVSRTRTSGWSEPSSARVDACATR
jgi:hypothetical protein